VGGPGTLPKSFQAVRYGGWIHSIGAVAKVSTSAASYVKWFTVNPFFKSDEKVHAGLAVIRRSSVLRGIIAGSLTQ